MFAAVVESTQCFEVDLTLFFLLSDKNFNCFVFLFSSPYYWERLSVPQLIPVVECELQKNAIGELFSFLPDPCCIDLLHFILEQCPLQVTTVKMCIIMKYLLRHRFLCNV